MRLLLVRHGEAVERGKEGIPDDLRPLTREGERRFRKAARGLARLGPTPDLILTSPLPRARRTAEIAARAFGRVQIRESANLASGDHEALAQELAGHEEDLVALFGHEPHLSALLAALLGSVAPDRLAFGKGGAALVDLPGGLSKGGQLAFFLPPKLLRRAASKD